MIDNIDIQKIKDAASIVDVVGDFCDLHKRGTHYECLCPFHEDRHLGSFVVSPQRNTFTCFSCGEHGGPVDFVMKIENLTFPDAIRWLGAKYGIPVEGCSAFLPKPSKPRTPPPPLPMLVLPHSHVLRRNDTSHDTLCNWIRQLPWNEEQRGRVEQMIRNYMICHSVKGHTIFWQMDENGKLRTGKMMLYKADGHRDRISKGNFSWIHTALENAGQYDPDKEEVRTCLFGQHLLDHLPKATINIVESEKTALICAIAYGHMHEHLWMATGGLSFLSRDRLLPLIQRGRYITLYPDHDGISKWQDIADSIGYERLHVNADFMQRYWQPEDGPKADLADILIRMMQHTRACRTQQVGEVIRELAAINPALQTLINEMKLTPVIQ